LSSTITLSFRDFTLLLEPVYPQKRPIPKLFRGNLHVICPGFSIVPDIQLGCDPVEGLAGRESFDNGILYLAPFAMYVLAAAGFGKRVNAVKDLTAPVSYDVGRILTEEFERSLICRIHLPGLRLHQQDRGSQGFEKFCQVDAT
jgi:hypothetical protein